MTDLALALKIFRFSAACSSEVGKAEADLKH
jgi:hypothetical protein